jgi:hypothetical protein
MSKFINKFCEWCNIKAPKHESEIDLIICIAAAWIIVLLGMFAMWLFYGG